MIENLFPYIAIYSALVPVLLFLLNWKKCKISRPLWVVFFYCLLVDYSLSYGVDFVAHRPLKIVLYASFTIFEYLFFSYFLYQIIKNAKAKFLLLLMSLSFFIFLIVYYSLIKFKRIDSVPIGVETILVMIFSFYYLYEEMNDSSTLFIYAKPAFWIVFGIVLYLSGSFFIYIFAGSLSKEELNKYWFVTNILSIMKNIFFCIAILLQSGKANGRNNIGYMLNLSRLN